MKKIFWRQYKIYAILLCITLICNLFLTVTAENDSVTNGTGNHITFDNFRTVKEANLETGGGLSIENVFLDNKTYRGDSGKSVLISGRSQAYHRIKIMDAFKGVDTTPGLKYNISVWAKVAEDSEADAGFFYISVINFLGNVGGDKAYYNYKDTTKTRKLINKNEWTQITLPYTIEESGVFGIAVEQLLSGNYTKVVTSFNIDDVTVTPVADTEVQGSGDYNILTFDDCVTIDDANLGTGGGQHTADIFLDDKVRHNNIGKSILVINRTHPYQRIKFLDAFKGLDLKPGELYNISLWAQVAEDSTVDKGYFFLSVIDFEGTPGTGREYYRNLDYKTVVGKGYWTQITLPYVVGENPVYGVAVEQAAMPDVEEEDYVVPMINFDTLEVTKATTPVPPPDQIEEIQIPSADAIKVIVNGTRLRFNGFNDTEPVIENGRTLVPMRKIFEALEADISWDGATNTVTATRLDKTISLSIGSNTAKLNGEDISLDVPASLINGRTMVPVRFVAESLDANVEWNETRKTVTITTKQENIIAIDKTKIQQEIWGFGASANNPVYNLMNFPNEENKKAILDELFGNEGSQAGFTIIRLEVNPYKKTAPRHQDAIQATILPEDGVWDFDTDHHQRWFADEALKRNKNMQFAASVWSPPAWMKDNNSELDGHLLPENYDKFANYLKVWTETYRGYGYDIKWMSVQNEPRVVTNSSWAGCAYTHEEMDIVASKVVDAFRAANLPTMVGAPEGASLETTLEYLENISEETLNKLDFLATHFYGWGNDYLEKYNLEKYNKPMFQMEFRGPAPDDPGIENGIFIASQIQMALAKGYNSYLYWWFVNPPTKPGTPTERQSLIDVKQDGTYTTTKRLYTMGQYSRFIKPGDHKIKSISGNPDLMVTAAKNLDTDKASIVVINKSDKAYTTTIKGLTASSVDIYRTSDTENIAALGSKKIENGTLIYEFAPKSVTTIVEK